MSNPVRLVLVLILIILTGCVRSSTFNQENSALDQVDLYLSWHDGTQFLGFYVADEAGFYADEELRVNIIPIESSGAGDVVPVLVAENSNAFGVGGTAAIFPGKQH